MPCQPVLRLDAADAGIDEQTHSLGLDVKALPLLPDCSAMAIIAALYLALTRA